MTENTPNTKSLKVLVIDDDANIAKLITRATEDFDCDHLAVTDSTLAARTIAGFDPDLIFLDLCMPGMDGIEVIQYLAESACQASIVLMSGLKQRVLNSALDIASSHRLSIVTTLRKPFGMNRLKEILINEIENRQVKSAPATINCFENSLPGPVLSYEPVTNLQPQSEGGTRCLRIDFAWRADDGALIPFDSLINADHKREVIAGLTNLMIVRLRSDMREAHCGQPGNYHFHYTVKPGFLIHPDNVSMLQGILQANDLAASMFTLEVDEKTILTDPERINASLARLELHGFRIALVCSQESDTVLARIKRLPIDELQIDLAANPLLSGRVESAEADFWLGSLVAVASKENLAVSVRNMSSNPQYQLAVKCGINKASGNFMGAPQSLVELQQTTETAQAV